jgi:hypothetical protein
METNNKLGPYLPVTIIIQELMLIQITISIMELMLRGTKMRIMNMVVKILK